MELAALAVNRPSFKEFISILDIITALGKALLIPFRLGDMRSHFRQRRPRFNPLTYFLLAAIIFTGIVECFVEPAKARDLYNQAQSNNPSSFKKDDLYFKSFANGISIDLAALTSTNPQPLQCAVMAQQARRSDGEQAEANQTFLQKCIAHNSNPPPAESALQRSISEAELTKLFADLAKSNEIAFEMPEGANCHGRAHLMAKYFEQHGIYSQKLFVYQTPMIVQNPFVVGHQMTWHSHVAVVIRVKMTNGSEEERIIDPSTFARPARIDEWMRNLTKDKCTALTESNKEDNQNCRFRRLERFAYMGNQFETKTDSWRSNDIEASCKMMNEDIVPALHRRSIGAGMASPDGNGRMVPSGACLWVPFSLTRDEKEPNHWIRTYEHSTCETARTD